MKLLAFSKQRSKCYVLFTFFLEFVPNWNESCFGNIFSVAKKMVASAIRPSPPFFVYFGLEGWMVATLTAGMAPVHNVIDAMYQIFLMSILRFVSLFYLMDFRRIIRKVGVEKRSRS